MMGDGLIEIEIVVVCEVSKDETPSFKKKKKKMFISDSPYRVLQIGALLHQVLGVLELATIDGKGQSGPLVLCLECEGAHEGRKK